MSYLAKYLNEEVLILKNKLEFLSEDLKNYI